MFLVGGASLLRGGGGCPICVKAWDEDTVVLACGHAVCADCLEQLRSRNTEECPICRSNAIKRPAFEFRTLYDQFAKTFDFVKVPEETVSTMKEALEMTLTKATRKLRWKQEGSFRMPPGTHVAISGPRIVLVSTNILPRRDDIDIFRHYPESVRRLYLHSFEVTRVGERGGEEYGSFRTAYTDKITRIAMQGKWLVVCTSVTMSCYDVDNVGLLGRSTDITSPPPSALAVHESGLVAYGEGTGVIVRSTATGNIVYDTGGTEYGEVRHVAIGELPNGTHLVFSVHEQDTSSWSLAVWNVEAKGRVEWQTLSVRGRPSAVHGLKTRGSHMVVETASHLQYYRILREGHVEKASSIRKKRPLADLASHLSDTHFVRIVAPPSRFTTTRDAKMEVRRFGEDGRLKHEQDLFLKAHSPDMVTIHGRRIIALDSPGRSLTTWRLVGEEEKEEEDESEDETLMDLTRPRQRPRLTGGRTWCA